MYDILDEVSKGLLMAKVRQLTAARLPVAATGCRLSVDPFGWRLRLAAVGSRLAACALYPNSVLASLVFASPP